MNRFIRDTFGQKYPLIVNEDSADLFYVEVKDKGERIGRAACSFKLTQSMIIEDLIIRDDSDEKPKFFMPRGKSKLKNYRHRGLGTELLNIIVDHARRNSIRHIYGSIVQEDIDRTPSLVEFYKKRGFRRCDPYPGLLG